MRKFLKLIQILSIFFISFKAMSSLPKLASEYLEANAMIKSNKFDLDIAKITLEQEEDIRPWSVSASFFNTDSDKEISILDTYLPTNTKSASLNISKDFIWGGEFSILNSLSKSSYEGSATETNIFSQSFNYSQDLGANFFGRNDRLNLLIAEDTYELSKVKSLEEINSNLYSFINSYTDVVLSKTRKEIAQRALKRNKIITKIVKRRVKDGLREKVDLYLAKNSEISSTEKIQESEESVLKNLEVLSTLIHRSVEESEIEHVNLKKQKMREVPLGDIELGTSVKALKKSLEIANRKFDQSSHAILPTLSFDASYSVNDYDTETKKAFSNGLIGTDRDGLSLGVNISIPLGFKSQKNTKAISGINRARAQVNYQAGKHSIREREKLIKKQIILIDQSIKLGSKRLDYARKSLVEYNRLYKKGRTEIDRVLSAEDSLNNIELTLAGYYVKRDLLVFSLYYIYGSLSDHFLKM